MRSTPELIRDFEQSKSSTRSRARVRQIAKYKLEVVEAQVQARANRVGRIHWRQPLAQATGAQHVNESQTTTVTQLEAAGYTHWQAAQATEP